ncbi:hypothetical protein SAMN04487944_10183 [Gracilibacillus ureilyticus]|uniref:Hook-length control protein FliK n=1 Tax=Gracilibacillus ureilyticus TaxID=531814 RepID=A0A1H9L3S6_9BACI|nr:hypothetical protein [Gracilibacillus ureilyticus]SER05978.1 hypothetical protein SAMN04487944_10183 [Gracilibacillus ureilyticus]
MNMHTIMNSLQTASANKANSPMNLRSGQMIAGKVLELYPNQKAKIQIGGMQVVAQLETALSAKQGYIFQVVSTTNTLHLKKVNDISLASSQSLERLLQQLGVSPTNNNRELLTQLLSKNIPFTNEDAQLIARLLEKFGGNRLNQELLLTMVEKKLPITEQVFQSLQAVQQNNIGTDMKGLMNQLQSIVNQSANGSSPQLPQMMINHLNQFLGATQMTNSFPLLSNENSQILFQLMQRIGQIEPDVSLSKFQTIMQQMTSQLNPNPSSEVISRQLLQNQFIQQTKPVVQQLQPLLTKSDAEFLLHSIQNSQTVMQNSQQIANILLKSDWESANFLTPHNKAVIQQFTKEVLQFRLQENVRQLLQSQLPFNHGEQRNFDMLLKRLSNENQPNNQPNQVIQELKNMLSNSDMLPKIVSTMTRTEIETIQNWLRNPLTSLAQNQQIADLLQKINIQQFSQQEAGVVREFLLKTDQLITNEPQSVRDHFLSLMKQFIQNSGIQDEANILQQKDDQQSLSLKQLLLLGTQQGTELGGERAAKLLQTLTGMQLQMINQEQSFTHLNMQFPGEKFGLMEDIRIQFEGKKNGSSKEIDPDYCKVLFHLNLNKLGETMIAMSIQKRVVHLTVYNDRDGVKPVLAMFKPLLKEKLADLNYNLTSVTWKSTKEEDSGNRDIGKHNPYVPRTVEGIDFRV